MTKEEEIRANAPVMLLQGAWEHMVNQAINAVVAMEVTRLELATAKTRIQELEEKYEPKTPAADPAP